MDVNEGCPKPRIYPADGLTQVTYHNSTLVKAINGSNRGVDRTSPQFYRAAAELCLPFGRGLTDVDI